MCKPCKMSYCKLLSMALSYDFSHIFHSPPDPCTCRFECIGDGTNNTINNVTLEPTKYDSNEQSSAYDGPVSCPSLALRPCMPRCYLFTGCRHRLC